MKADRKDFCYEISCIGRLGDFQFYGHAMNIRKIVTMDEQVYQEEVVVVFT